MGLKENIKSRRLELNLTLEEVAKHLNVSKPTVQRYESGVIDNIPFTKIEQLADILETTPSCLMGWEEKTKLTAQEAELLKKYRQLDDLGKHTINTVLQMEFDRIKK